MENAELIALLTPVRDALNAALAKLAPVAAPAPVPTPVFVGRTPENPAGTVPGLNYSYYEGTWNNLPDFTKLPAVASGTVLVPNLDVRKREDFFGLRYVGFLSVPADAEYTFYTVSDDGTRLTIGNQVVVLNDGVHGPQEQVGKISLKKGVHAFALDYFEYNNGQEMSVSYSSASIPKTTIPASAYSRVAPAAPVVVTPAPAPVVTPTVKSLTAKKS